MCFLYPSETRIPGEECNDLSITDDHEQTPQSYYGKIRPVKDFVTIEGKYRPYMLDSTFSQIVCHCDNSLFQIFLSAYPEVKCVCPLCGEAYLVL